MEVAPRDRAPASATMKILIDGQFFDEANAKISVFDHGFLYGDGIFEGMRVYGGRIFLLREHLDRLFASARAILLELPLSHDELSAAVVRACRENGVRDGYIRLIVSRGVGPFGLHPSKCKRPSVVVIADQIQVYPSEVYAKGLEVVTVATTRNLHSALNPAIKSLNYLNNVLAKIEAKNSGCEEAIMVNGDGYVAECTGQNIFLVKGSKLLTPPMSSGALCGITRDVVMQIASDVGLTASEPNLTRYDVFNADECFLTGTATEIMPVTKVDGRKIGNGMPGARTAQITDRFRTLTQTTGEPIGI
jgi:branched-chain amino acid aminotransferase